MATEIEKLERAKPYMEDLIMIDAATADDQTAKISVVKIISFTIS